MNTFDTLASAESIARARVALEKNGFRSEVVNTGAEALARIKTLIPAGASIQNGTSTTLEQIGFIDYLKLGTHGWNNLHEAILAETDAVKKEQLRKEALLSDYYLGSVHALSETGEMVIASNTGSQLPHLAFTSKNLILVVSTQKITATLSDAFRRVEEHVVPLEDARALVAYKSHTLHSKTLVLHKENPYLGRNVLVLLVEEKLGF
jgi:hypothetical protein